MAKGDVLKLLDKMPSDKRKAAEEALNGIDGLLTELDSGYMRQDDYSKSMDQAKKDREEWEAEKTLMEENYAKAKRAYDEMYADWTTSTEERQKAAAALKKAESERDEAKSKSNIDPEKVMTIDRYKEDMNKFASGQSVYFSETLDAAFQVEQVTGQRVNPAKIYEEAIKAKRSPLDYAEDAYKLSEKRKEKEAGDQKKLVEEAEKRGYDKRVAEDANPNTRQHVASDHPFYQATGDGVKQPWQQTEIPADEQKMLEELIRAKG